MKKTVLSLSFYMMLFLSLFSNRVLASTAIPKTQKIQESEASSSPSSIAVEKKETDTEALPNKGDRLSICQDESISPISSEEDAIDLAMQYAELSREEVSDLRCSEESDDGKIIYEISFLYGALECSYEFNGENGAFLEFSYEILREDLLFPLPEGPISQETAKQTALAQVAGAEEDDIMIETDQDDGLTIYEGTILYDNIEYEFEIDAASGVILEWSAESVFS